MLFQTRDNVSLWLQIIAVALSIAILVTGGLMIFWSWYFGRIGDGQYIPNQGTNIGSGTIIEEPNDPDLEDPRSLTSRQALRGISSIPLL